ncbi:hypothetical protein BJ741DRAFT_706356 [Chytriomyces cf. hyalinus JEL632]|nr:hypothetical protein BJ741DRAFT_706356 [Chytriomyces cf. hyalinus JEL632]
MTLILLLALLSSILVHAFPAPSALPAVPTTADDSEWEWVDVVVSTPCTTTSASSSTTTLSNAATTFSKPPRFSRSSSISHLGGNCGGFMANSPRCAEGLVCVYSHSPDLPGTCQRAIYHQIGESCGGRSFNPPICVTGLVCVTDDEEGPHSIGTCQNESASIETTESSITTATTATTSTTTLTTSTATTTTATTTTSTNTASTSTTTTATTATTTTTTLTPTSTTATSTTTPSQPDINDVGEPCGGFIANPPICKPGLICVRMSLNPDLPGHCVLPPSETKTTLQSTASLNEPAPPTSNIATVSKTATSSPAASETTTLFNANSPDLPNTPLSSLKPQLFQIIAGTPAHVGSFKDGCIDVFEFVPVSAESFQVAFLDVPGRNCGPRDATARFRRYFSRGKISLQADFVDAGFEFRVGYDAVTGGLERRQALAGVEKAWSFLYSFNSMGESETEVETGQTPTPAVLTPPALETETVETSTIMIETTTTVQGQVGQICGGGTQFAVECASGLKCVVQEPQMPGKTGVCQTISSISSSATPSAVVTSTSMSVDLGNGIGSECGEDAAFGRECDSGLECVVSPPYAPGKLGTCQVIRLLDGSETATVSDESTTTISASHSTTLQIEITSNFMSQMSTTTSSEAYGPIGYVCGGNLEFALACQPGLECLVEPPYFPGKTGLCQPVTPPHSGATETEPATEMASTEAVEPTTSFLPVKVNGINGTCGGFIANAPVCAEGLICIRNRRIPDMPGRCQLETSSTEGPTEVVPPAETLTESPQSTASETTSATTLPSSSVSGVATLSPTEQLPPTAGSASASTTPTPTASTAQTALPLITETSSSSNMCPVVEPVTVYITKEVHDFVTIHDVVTVTVTVDGKAEATSSVEAAQATELGSVVV